MYHHVKKLMYTVRVDTPDPAFGNMLLEQFGGANGELAAAMQYSVQGLNCEDPERKDLLMDIGTEELSHLEIVGALARLHLKPMKFDREYAETADRLHDRRGNQGRLAIPHDPRDHGHEGIRTRQHEQAAVHGRTDPRDAEASSISSYTSIGSGEEGEIDARCARAGPAANSANTQRTGLKNCRSCCASF